MQENNTKEQTKCNNSY